MEFILNNLLYLDRWIDNVVLILLSTSEKQNQQNQMLYYFMIKIKDEISLIGRKIQEDEYKYIKGDEELIYNVFILDKFAGAGYLLNEMKIIK